MIPILMWLVATKKITLTPKLMDAMKAHAEATKKLCEEIEKNPQGFTRLVNTLFHPLKH